MAKKKYYLILDENGFVKSVNSTDNIPYGDIQVDWYPTDRPITEYKYDPETNTFTLDSEKTLAEVKKEKILELKLSAVKFLESGTDVQTTTFGRTPLRFTESVIQDLNNLRVQMENGVENLYFAPDGKALKAITTDDAKLILSTMSYYITYASAIEQATIEWCNSCATVEEVGNVGFTTKGMPAEMQSAFNSVLSNITNTIYSAKAVGKVYQEKTV